MHILICAFQTIQFIEMTMNTLRVLSANQDGCVQVHLYEFTRNKWLFMWKWYYWVLQPLGVDDYKFQESESSEISWEWKCLR